MPAKKLTFSDALLTSRPFWWIITALPFIAGYFTHGIVFSLPAVIGALYFSFPYNLFLYGVNDIFDYESDIRNPRKSGIEGALLEREKHKPLLKLIAVWNLPFLAYFVAIGNLHSTVWLAFMIGMCAAYSVKHLRLKELPFIDSLSSAFRYAAPLLFGIFLAGGGTLWLPVFGVIYLWSVGNHAFGAIQDIEPDRAAGVRTIATTLGATNTAVLCFFCYMVAAALPSLFYGKEGIIPTLLLVPYIGLVARTFSAKDKEANPIFHRSWELFTYLNYPIGALVTMYLLSLIKY
jgi:4-hydroxybenzoate polyprenyltransferase